MLNKKKYQLVEVNGKNGIYVYGGGYAIDPRYTLLFNYEVKRIYANLTGEKINVDE